MATTFAPAAAAPMPIRCPRCGTAMTTFERSGVVLDQCRDCRGIFLDRGELERLVAAEGGAWLGPVPSSDPVSASRPFASHPATDPAGRGPHATHRSSTPRHYYSEWSIDDHVRDAGARTPIGTGASRG